MSNSHGAQSHGAADLICIHQLLTASMPKATITSVGSKAGNAEADVAPALSHATLIIIGKEAPGSPGAAVSSSHLGCKGAAEVRSFAGKVMVVTSSTRLLEG